MRILAITHLFPTHANPAYGIWCPRQLAPMAAMGADVHVFVPTVLAPRVLRLFKRWRKYNHQRPLCSFKGLKTQVVPYPRPTGNWYYRWAGYAVYRAMRKQALSMHRDKPFDVIYATCLFPDGDAARHLGKLLGIPTCCLAIGSDVNVYPDFSKTLYRHFVRIVDSLDATLACGDGLAERIASVCPKTSPVVHGVVDFEVFHPPADKKSFRQALQFGSDEVVMIFVGGLKRTKGLYELVEALRLVRKQQKNVVLKVIGSGIEENGLKALASEYGLQSSIEFVGSVLPDDIHRWMKAADVLVLPSYEEGMPNVVMEAMACGLPVVSTAVGGMPKAVGECAGVILVPPRTIDDLSKALERVCSDASLRAQMGSAAADWSPRFSAEHSACFILNYLAKLVEQHRSRGITAGPESTPPAEGA